MMTDPIADMLTRIRNAAKSRKRTTEVPVSKVKRALADLLKAEGYLQDVAEIDGNPRMLVLTLAYQGKQSKIQSITRESKPGHRVYRKSDEMPRVLNDYGIAIVSTSKGIMTNKQARQDGVGGEVLCSIY
ncbi:MAG: 30S ribosomal protein S8 [Candidatus Magasanikbacteria bacterium GW2011_GWD2_43_18]|uniref:Small ribosomal subunit protein uS8 n=1 Tax=Candidatus Magasanikbacteria bacterium GW2011_GWE2_42_7 TaxID=1619052 RepID=A0A0G1BCN7_9BACT|nr:MAG: 30S ribosomal protein S8 [Candidatus Magasanikbacteria bacterium GW2011_GWC2_42_27]KKS71115.1 MAG: 30S ribosomal protein S8 [Candidatus Magasanikbacteria bacterium GW2011_GWE2_42_7]KKT04289.1 MAG: 30S ribosomal protein S8 [Candidatus Magasanikbacteria bacterium GW2011_GWD2_43_18]KKT24864.1 MAG: 30S ribosomal protein S8 [Candidatus Magasanikbacteria bacterium GW2011_GWA2_43_9]HBB38367.1 30S ribosomal protein S8 [Candidatus Magasanikbacteria bacterium]